MAESGYILEVTAATNRGLVRAINEDAVLAGEWLGLGDGASHTIKRHSFKNVLLAVADGLGGHNAGDAASRLVVERLAALGSTLSVGDIDGAIGAILSIDEELILRATATPSLRGMGSTLALALVSPDALTLVNVGDSRIYFSKDDGELRQVSIDDTPVSHRDRLPSRSGNDYNRRSSHLVTQALGGRVSRRTRLDPHGLHLNSSAPWTLLICSDGLTDCVDERSFVENIVTKRYAADDLVAMTLDSGGHDNVSVIVARCIAR